MLTDSVSQYSPYDTLMDIVYNFLDNIITSVFVGFCMTSHNLQDLVESFGLNPR